VNPVVRNFFRKAFPKYTLYWTAFNALIKNENSYLYSTGWMRSLQEGKPVNNQSQVLPWMNYPVIRFLEDRLRNELKLFEYGSGYSTPFYAKHVKSVMSVENDKDWLSVIGNTVPENVTLIFKDLDVDGEYCRAVHLSGHKYDVIIVDGRDRVNCLKQSINALTDVGIVLLDDSERESYLEGIAYVMGKGFRTLDFEGLKPIWPEMSRATIFYRIDNCLYI
jgi:hypothetical protein